MDVSDLIEAIDALDNKFLEEAEQDLSIEEIAKLQEEFSVGQHRRTLCRGRPANQQARPRRHGRRTLRHRTETQ